MLANRYRVQRTVGQALYGDVWLCEDTKCENELVAVKQVSLGRAKRALATYKHMDNPFDERRIAVHLMELDSHDNILQVRHEFLENGSWCMVMEYCEGGDLLSRIQDLPENRLDESLALHYFRQVVRGVHFLHDSGVAHRDLSLENVLLKNGVCKICDFGLSTEANRTCSESVGKGYYMAPEVLSGEAYDPLAADMWTLGVMLFIMLTGSPLVPCASREEKAFLALETFGVEKILELRQLAPVIDFDKSIQVENRK
ncbi:hypothetical protein Poli38472_012768 [Pythium oligandrum]|uniref:Protein kinase domain-containing protein n=1 Tax=Pythium oligandrum TaxID=41045 RepID=A0A8K1FJA1_PYTOL|nr:hypothetical protein Poli38472_012768 [Pythium oligandrum]|eukprot:TMW61577.1 hypothetical protein Poli38472_012768 [Pythium oligandrum]